MSKITLEDIKKNKNEILHCKIYPNCNAFKYELEKGDTLCGSAMLCQTHMEYIEFIEKLTSCD